MTATGLHRNNFDLLRLLAAFQVAFFHSAAHLDVPLDLDHPVARFFADLPGVPIFFVISGFLISASFERNPDLRSYARNRALRIFPALWVCLAVGVATAALGGGVSFLRAEAVPWLVAQLTVGQFYNPEFLRGYGTGVLNGSLWTIPVEIQFYVALPLLYGALRLRRSAGTAALLVVAAISGASVVAWAALGGDAAPSFGMKLFGVSLVPYLWMFLLGILAQRHFDRLAPILRGRALWWLALYALMTPFGDHLGGGVDPKDPSLVRMVVLAGATVSCAYTLPGVADRILRKNDVSYGIYIYHMLVVNLLLERGVTGSFAVLGGALTATVAAATLSWVLVERPALRLKRDPLRDQTSGTASSTR